MIQKAAWLLLMGLILAPVAAMAQNAGKEKAAVSAAEKWLGLVDKAEYGASWKESASYFRGRITEPKWAEMAKGVRGPLGNLDSRKLANETYKSSLPGAPDGEYVIMQFDASFANKKSAVETVTAVMDKDGAWRVAGYFIR